MNCYLIYHPKRDETKVGDLHVFHDSFKGNQDPYLWNKQFLHTFCHITQLKNEPGQINFWISGDMYPNFQKLYCDCVFVIDQKIFWDERNNIELENPIVDNQQSFKHHYSWVNSPHNQHHFKIKRRYTLKADAYKSFQPQSSNKKLIDILPFLNQNGLMTDSIIKKMTTRRGSRPLKIEEELGEKLYNFLFENSSFRLKGMDLFDKYPQNLLKTI